MGRFFRLQGSAVFRCLVDNSYQSSYFLELKWLPDNAAGSAVEQISQEWLVDRIGDDKHCHQRMAVAEHAQSMLPRAIHEYDI